MRQSAKSCIPVLLGKDLQVDILLAPDGQAREQVLFANQAPREIRVTGEAGGGRDTGAAPLTADVTGRDFHPRVVADPLGFPRVAAGHDVELAVVLGEPHGRVYRRAGLAVRHQIDVALAAKRVESRHERSIAGKSRRRRWGEKNQYS